MKNNYIGLMVEDSSNILIGLLGILKSGNCIVPINPEFPGGRIRFIVEDCRINVILTDRSNYARVRLVARECSCLEHVICIDDIAFKDGNKSRSIYKYKNETASKNGIEGDRKSKNSGTGDHPLRPEQSCYIIYTSGSTGKPKGVPIEHRNLVPLLLWFHDYFRLGEHIKVLQNLSYTFDFGIFELVTTLLAGGTLCFFNKQTLSDLNEYVDFIYQHQINVIHTTPSFFTNVIDLGRPLSPLKLLHFGGERLTRRIVEYVSRQVGENCYIYNGYGPTEATINSAIFSLCVDAGRKVEVPDRIPIGKPTANNIIFILDAYGNLAPPGVVGELCISGTGLAGGYVNNPELTAEKFISAKQELSSTTLCALRCASNEYAEQSAAKLYCTGDLARWLIDGNIEFLGRIDQQVKIRGFRIELGEIEKQLLKHPDIKETVVEAVDLVSSEMSDSEILLCAYIVAGRQFSRSELRNHLLHRIPDYMIPSNFIQLKEIPLTANGKVDRKRLPVPNSVETGKYISPRDEVEKKLLDIWSEVMNMEKRLLSIESDFFEIGGHSLLALKLVNLIEKELRVKVKFRDIFKFSTIAALGELIRGSRTSEFSGIKKQPRRDFYELSYSQQRMWVLFKLDPNNPAFNLSGRLTLYDRFAGNIIREVLKTLVVRHASFRTYFTDFQGKQWQIVQDDAQVDLHKIDLSDLNEAQRKVRCEQVYREGISTPFNIEQAPLFRTKLLKLQEDRFELLFTMHHIISDGWSMEILKQEFSLLYESYKSGISRELKPLRLQYTDYAVWHNKRLADDELMSVEKKFWKDKLKGTSLPLNLPYDYDREEQKSKRSSGYRCVIPGETVVKLRKKARQQQASIFMVLLACFNLLLSRITGQNDIMIGVPGAGRLHEDLKDIIGFFVNTLIIRNSLDPGEPFLHFLSRVQTDAFKTLEYQSYPLELICKELKIEYPRITVFFNMLNIGYSNQEHLDSKGSYNTEEVQDAKFDLVFYLKEYKNGIEIIARYYRELFNPTTVEEILQMYMKIIESTLDKPARTIEELVFAQRRSRRKIKRN